MQQGAYIGSSVVITGEISSREPLTISGRVEGIIDGDGHVITVEAGAQVTADITASSIVIGGSVKGALTAAERIAIRSGAEVDGDLKAPRIAIDEGAIVTGKVEIAGTRKLDLARAS